MFWTVLLLIVCFSAVASIFFWMLAMLIGEWALVVASAYQKITTQLDSVEQKLDQMLEQKEDV